MNRKSITGEEQIAGLLQNLVAIELWRGGLPQGEIGRRLGVAAGTVSGMLKGVARQVSTSSAPPK